MPVLFDLFAEILPGIEQGYKAQAACLRAPSGDPYDDHAAALALMKQPIRVIVPLPTSLLTEISEPLDTVYARLNGVPWIEAAGPFNETAVKDAAGATVFDLSGGDFVAIDVTCKPFRDVHLA